MSRQSEKITHNGLERIFWGNRRLWGHGRVAGGDGHAGGAGQLGVGQVLLIVRPIQGGGESLTHRGQSWVARMEVINSTWSQGLGYHRPVVEKDNRAEGGKKMSVAVVIYI